jgi:hypothetical protein
MYAAVYINARVRMFQIVSIVFVQRITRLQHQYLTSARASSGENHHRLLS